MTGGRWGVTYLKKKNTERKEEKKNLNPQHSRCCLLNNNNPTAQEPHSPYISSQPVGRHRWSWWTGGINTGDLNRCWLAEKKPLTQEKQVCVHNFSLSRLGWEELWAVGEMKRRMEEHLGPIPRTRLIKSAPFFPNSQLISPFRFTPRLQTHSNVCPPAVFSWIQTAYFSVVEFFGLWPTGGAIYIHIYSLTCFN